MHKSANRNSLLLIGGLVVLTLAVSFCARWTPRFPGDLQLTLLLQSIDNGLLRSVMEWSSFLFGGWRAALFVVAGAAVAWWRLGRLEGAAVLVAGLVSLVDSALKVAVNRPRPTPDLVRVFVAESESGFPSGHALFAAVVLGTFAYFIAAHVRKRSLRLLSLASPSTVNGFNRRLASLSWRPLAERRHRRLSGRWGTPGNANLVLRETEGPPPGAGIWW